MENCAEGGQPGLEVLFRIFCRSLDQPSLFVDEPVHAHHLQDAVRAGLQLGYPWYTLVGIEYGRVNPDLSTQFRTVSLVPARVGKDENGGIAPLFREYIHLGYPHELTQALEHPAEVGSITRHQ